MITLIRREISYFYLKSPLVLILNLLVILFILPARLYSIFRVQVEDNISLVIQLLPAVVILLLGMQFLVMQFYREKVNRTIEVLFALGYSPFKVWFCKIVSIWIVTYVLYVIGILFSLGLVTVVFPTNILHHRDLLFYLNLFLFSPPLGFAILGISGVLHLILNDVRIINVGLIVLAILFFSFIPKISHIISTLIAIITTFFPLVSILLSALLIGVCWMILNITPAEKYLL
jgi:hypothetical protein